MLGLCEFALGRDEAALTHIQQGRRLGTSADPQFRQVMLYHEGVLLLRKAEFERAQETLGGLAADGVDHDELTVALGASVLRVDPRSLPAGDAPLRRAVVQAGRAEALAARKQLDAAEREYQALVQAFAGSRHVHYALGRFYVATQQPDEALAAYAREIAVTPDHVPARLGIAAIKAETDPAEALPYAEEAVRLNPRIPLGHYLLGSLLLENGQAARAITELELARTAVPDNPEVHYALGRAYARAGRTADAERARATFARLTRERDLAARRPAGLVPPAEPASEPPR
jgi:predicted Zn-dependent protease